jgi:hypothetical protein
MLILEARMGFGVKVASMSLIHVVSKFADIYGVEPFRFLQQNIDDGMG